MLVDVSSSAYFQQSRPAQPQPESVSAASSEPTKPKANLNPASSSEPAKPKANLNQAGAPKRDICTQCRSPFEQIRFKIYKTCPKCREKNRIQNRKYRERQDAKTRTWALGPMKGIEGAAGGAGGEGMVVDENVNVRAGSGTASVGLKRRAEKALDEMEGEEKRVALAAMKNGLKTANVVRKANKRANTTKGVTSISGEGKEYQTATALYDALKARASKVSARGKTLKFQGFHAIIANSTIDHLKRVELVAKDLRKIARVGFDHRNPTPSYDFETMGRTATYTCRCLGEQIVPVAPTTLAPAPVSSKTTMKGTQGDLIRQARLAQAKTPLVTAQSVPRLCGGKVKVTAVDDGRHPLGIVAQRISILIEHPSTDRVS